MRFVIVTPVRNAGALIEPTIASIRHQTALRSGRVALTYLVQDGASTDDTIERATRALAQLPDNITAEVRSTPDAGMYDALANAFAHLNSTTHEHGDDEPTWFAYLNAGDLYAPTAFDVLADIAEQTDSQWVCGLHAYFNAHGTLVHTRLPPRFRADLIRAGAYGRGLPTIQQESTFWSADLQRSIDLEAMRSYRLAGDAYLWHTFAQRTEPTIIQALLGGFTYHGGHLGTSHDAYRAELDRIHGPLTTKTRARIPAEIALWEAPARIKARSNPNLYLHDTTTGNWVNRTGAIRPSGAH